MSCGLGQGGGNVAHHWMVLSTESLCCLPVLSCYPQISQGKDSDEEQYFGQCVGGSFVELEYVEASNGGVASIDLLYLVPRGEDFLLIAHATIVGEGKVAETHKEMDNDSSGKHLHI